jgi:hypothetical protein
MQTLSRRHMVVIEDYDYIKKMDEIKKSIVIFFSKP